MALKRLRKAGPSDKGPPRNYHPRCAQGLRPWPPRPSSSMARHHAVEPVRNSSGPGASIVGVVLSWPDVACPAAVPLAVSPPAAPSCDLLHRRCLLNSSPDFTGVTQRCGVGGRYGCDGEQSRRCTSNDPRPEHYLCPLACAAFVAVRVERHISWAVPRGEHPVDHCSSHTRDHTFRFSLPFLSVGHGAQCSAVKNKRTLRRLIMKTILSALVALSFVAGVVAPASAAEFSIKTLDQDSRGGHAN